MLDDGTASGPTKALPLYEVGVASRLDVEGEVTHELGVVLSRAPLGQAAAISSEELLPARVLSNARVSLEHSLLALHRPEDNEGNHDVRVAVVASDDLEHALLVVNVLFILRLDKTLSVLLDCCLYFADLFAQILLGVLLQGLKVRKFLEEVSARQKCLDGAVVFQTKEDLNNLSMILLCFCQALDLLRSCLDDFFEVLPQQYL